MVDRLRGRKPSYKVRFFVSRTKVAADGERWLDYVPSIQRFAFLEPLRGREFMNSGSNRAEVTHRITTHYDSEIGTIKETDRIAHGGRLYEIVYILNIEERNRTIEFRCKEWKGNNG